MILAGRVVCGVTRYGRMWRGQPAWDADLSAAHGETAWFARELLPQLQRAMTSVEVAVGWRVGALRHAVRCARRDVDGLLVSPDQAAQPRVLALIAGQLAEVLEQGPNTS